MFLRESIAANSREGNFLFQLAQYRAVATPAGLRDAGMELTLDEVGLPPRIAQALFKDRRIRTDEDLLRLMQGRRPWVWVKRDAVLHRWGLLRMKARVFPFL